MIKVDLEKAYDSLELPFLQAILQELGLPAKFVKWVVACLSTVSYSILVNGFPSSPIPAKKGLKQGDPMSPSLFALGMEYLFRCLSSLSSDSLFKYHPRCKKIDLTHMKFVDDLLMFSRGDEPSVSILLMLSVNFLLPLGWKQT